MLAPSAKDLFTLDNDPSEKDHMFTTQRSLRWTPLKTAVTLALCGAALHAPARAAGQDSAAAPAAAASAPTAVRPGDDFFDYVNGDWLKTAQIPADRSSWGAGAALAEETNQRIVKLIDAIGADPKAGAEAKKVADFYRTFLDEAAIEAKGVAPLQPALQQIAAIKDKSALAHALGATLRADVDPLNSTNFFTENLFGLWIAQGLTEPTHYRPYLLQGGLGMPDRAYYLDDTPRMAELRTKYQAHIAAMFKLAGYADADARAARVFELEHQIALSHAKRADSEDVIKANNRWSARTSPPRRRAWTGRPISRAPAWPSRTCSWSGIRAPSSARPRWCSRLRWKRGRISSPSTPSTTPPAPCRPPSSMSASISTAARCRARRNSRRAGSRAWTRSTPPCRKRSARSTSSATSRRKPSSTCSRWWSRSSTPSISASPSWTGWRRKPRKRRRPSSTRCTSIWPTASGMA